MSNTSWTEKHDQLMAEASPNLPGRPWARPEPFSRIERHEVTREDGITRSETYRNESQFHYLGALGRAVEGQDLDAVAEILAADVADWIPSASPAGSSWRCVG